MSEPYPVKPIVGILCASCAPLDEARRRLEDLLGTADCESQPVAFSHTDYYAAEMGDPLVRRFLSFERLIDPSRLVAIKIETMRIEADLACRGKRTVNLDPGYLDYCKLVLASAKYGGQKLYLGSGVWGDITLFYSKGKFRAPDWSFPDFRSGAYGGIFLEIRSLYKRSAGRDRHGGAGA